MRKHRGRFALTGVGLWMTLGCGGRSDTELYSEIEIVSGTGGVRSSTGGATSLIPLGGSKSLGGGAARGGSTAVGSATAIGNGGWSASGGGSARSGGAWSGGARASGGAWGGGALASGGTLASTVQSSVAAGSSSKGACCAAHNGLGCSDAVVESCVCRRDALCCAVGWDPVCVSEVTSRACGMCATGGASNLGGASGTVVGVGGWFSTSGGAVVSAGAAALGGNTSVPSGGNTSVPSGGNTSVPSGGNTSAPSGGGVSNLGGAAPVSQNVIDDLEDGDGELLVSEGRNGYWYTFNDGSVTGVQQPVSNGLITSAQPIDDNGSRFAAWTRGSGFISWGGGLGLTLRLSNRAYNASKYQGISFWAKTTRGSTNSVRVNVSDNQTVADGGICTECWDHFGLTVVLSEQWGRYSFAWTDLAQRGWGAPLVDAINPAKLSGIEFSTQEGVEFELYVDNVVFW